MEHTMDDAHRYISNLQWLHEILNYKTAQRFQSINDILFLSA